MKPKGIVGAGDADNRKQSDLYPTPKDVTDALFDLIQPILPGAAIIWEPACGECDMKNVINERGYMVIATDILIGRDFLTSEPPICFDWIITNPPFSQAEAFIRRAHSYRKPFAMLLKSQYWQAAGRLPLYRECTPDIIAPLTWRPDFRFKDEGKHGSPLMDVMWCVWLPEIYKTGRTRYILLERRKKVDNGT